MPILKHAKKKQRQDKKRTIHNRKIKETFKNVLKQAKAVKTPEALSKAFSALDKAAKANVIHANKAARLKSSLSKLAGGKKTTKQKPSSSQSSKKPAGTTTKKKSSSRK